MLMLKLRRIDSAICCSIKSILRAEVYQGLTDALAEGYSLEDIGRRTILPSSFTGSPRSMNQLFQDAMTIVGAKGPPNIFTTFTCNPHWAEITETLLPGQEPED